ncbi:MAG: SRPBCC family protein [Elainellaceae cyanobacterium]
MAETPAFQQATQDLADRQRSDLTQGRCVVVQTEDAHRGYVLIDTAPDMVWDVITDYENFPAFLPTVVETRVVADEGDTPGESLRERKVVVEQVDERQVLFTSVTSRIQTENVELPPDRVRFRLTEGDLNQFRGVWRVIAASTESGRPTLLMQEVTAEAGAGPLEMAFERILRSSLEKNLEAIAQEVYRRYQSKAEGA